MRKTTRMIAHAALIAAMYATICHCQNLLVPESANIAIQFRVAEALCVLAFFTPTGIPGLTLGCAVFNLTFAAALPMDALIGSLATALACGGMWFFRKVTVKNVPVIGLCLPAFWNALLVGWELTVYIGGGFLINAIYVAIGEAIVMLTVGAALYYAMKKRKLDVKLFA